MTKSGMGTAQPVGKLIADAQRAAGDQAVRAAERHEYLRAREWRYLSLELTRLLRECVELLARGEAG